MLTLIPFGSAHFDLLAGWFHSEAELIQWGGPSMSFPLNHEQLVAIVEEGRRTPPSRLSWTAQDGATPVGHAELALDWRNGNAVLSKVAIAPAARGRGFAAQMLEQVVDQAFALAEIERLELNVFSFNERARRIYERLGFLTEGIRRSSARVGEERWDTVIMALLRAEWAARSSSAP